MTVWLLGEARSQSSSVGFGPLPGKNRWTPVTTCLTATGPHSDIRIQFYDVPRTPTLGIDAVDVHQSFVEDGGFNDGATGWRRQPNTRFAIEPGGRIPTRPYAGKVFGLTSSSVVRRRHLSGHRVPDQHGRELLRRRRGGHGGACTPGREAT